MAQSAAPKHPATMHQARRPMLLSRYGRRLDTQSPPETPYAYGAGNSRGGGAYFSEGPGHEFLAL